MYGEFTSGRELRRDPFGALYAARKSGDKTDKYVVKTRTEDVIALADPDMGDPRAQIIEFLASMEIQSRLGRLPNSNWAPVLATGDTGSQAYAVMELYGRTARLMIDGRTKLDARGLYQVAHGTLNGLIQLREHASRAFGALKPANVLIDGKASSSKWKVRLSDPAAETDATTADDLNALGAILYSLVTHREWNQQMHPIRKTGEWNRLGSAADGWMLLINQLLDPKLADTLSAEDIRQQVERLGTGGGGVPVGAIAGIGALVVIGLGVGGAVMFGPQIWGEDDQVQVDDSSFDLTLADLEAWGRTHDRWVRELSTVYRRNSAIRDGLGPRFVDIFDSPHIDPPDRFGIEDRSGGAGERQLNAARSLAAYYGLPMEVEPAFTINPSVINREPVDPGEFDERVTSAVRWTLSLPEELSNAGGLPALRKMVDRMNAEDIGWTDLGTKFNTFLIDLETVLGSFGTAEGIPPPIEDLSAQEVLQELVEAMQVRQFLNASLEAWEDVRLIAAQLSESGDPVIADFGTLASNAVNAETDPGRIPSVIETYTNLGESISEELAEFERLGVDAQAFQANSSVHNDSELGARGLTREMLTSWVREARRFRGNWLSPEDDPRGGLGETIAAAAQRLEQAAATVSGLPDLEGDALADFESGLAVIREDLDDQQEDLAALLARPWTRENEARIQSEADAIRVAVSEIGSEIPDLITSARLASEQSEQEQINTVRAMRLDSGNDVLDTQWVSLVDAKVATYAGNDRAQLRAMSEELRALRQALITVIGGVSASRPVFDAEPNGWNRGALDAAYAALRSDLIEDATEQIVVDGAELRIGGTAADADAIRAFGLEQQRAVAAWTDAVSALAGQYAALEQRIDSLDVSVAEAESPIIASDLRASIEPVFEPVRERLALIQSAARSGDRRELIGLAGGEVSVGPDVPLLARYLAWERLGEDEFAWPASIAELEREADLQSELRVDLEVLMADALTDRLGPEGQMRWATAWSSAVGRGDRRDAMRFMDDVLGQMGAFGLSGDSLDALPGTVSTAFTARERFNLGYALTREAYRNSDTSNPAVQLEIMEAFESLQAAFDDAIDGSDRDVLNELGAQIGAAKSELDGGQAAGPSWDPSQVSPAAAGLGWVHDAGRSTDVLQYFSHQGPQSQLGRSERESLDLIFRLVEPQDGSDPFFMSTTEVPLAVLAEVLAAQGSGWMDEVWEDYRRAPNEPGNPDLGWGYQVGGQGQISLVSDWLLSKPMYSAQLSPYPPAMRAAGGWGIEASQSPGAGLPAHGLSIAGAITLANSLGCRVPTVSEWRAAAQSSGAAIENPNIADASFGALYSWQRQVGQGVIWPLGDGGVFEGVGGSLVDTPDFSTSGIDTGTNDGVAWFRPVTKDDRIRDLRGNVYEVVLDDSVSPAARSVLLPDQRASVEPSAILNAVSESFGQVGLIGGSALSSTSLGFDQVMRLEQPRTARFNAREMRKAHPDIGVRLVFPGGRGSGVQSLVDRLLDDPAYLF